MKSRPLATVQIWRLGDDGTPAWHDIGVATTERGLTRVLGTALDHTYGCGPGLGALRIVYSDGTSLQFPSSPAASIADSTLRAPC